MSAEAYQRSEALFSVVEDALNELKTIQQQEIQDDQWAHVTELCSKINGKAQQLFLMISSQQLHEIQEEHLCGILAHFERATDNLILSSSTCPNMLFRKIASYNAIIRLRTHGILRMQKNRERRRERLDAQGNPFDLLDE